MVGWTISAWKWPMLPKQLLIFGKNSTVELGFPWSGRGGGAAATLPTHPFDHVLSMINKAMHIPFCSAAARNNNSTL